RNGKEVWVAGRGGNGHILRFIGRAGADPGQWDGLRPSIFINRQIRESVQCGRVVHRIDCEAETDGGNVAIRVGDGDGDGRKAELIGSRGEGHGPVRAAAAEKDIRVWDEERI